MHESIQDCNFPQDIWRFVVRLLEIPPTTPAPPFKANALLPSIPLYLANREKWKREQFSPMQDGAKNS